MDLSDLKSVLAPLSQIGKDEFSFTIEGSTITVRPLLPHEEVAVQKHSAAILDSAQDEEGAAPDDNMSRATALDYFDRFRIEVVSHAVCQINDTDFRGINYIETGETLPNGKMIRLPRHVAVRDIIINAWSRSMITICFGKYGELVTKLAEAADNIGKEAIPDIEVELSRTQERLSQLEGEKARRAKGDPGIMEDQIRSLVEADGQMKKDVGIAIKAARALTSAKDVSFVEGSPEIPIRQNVSEGTGVPNTEEVEEAETPQVEEAETPQVEEVAASEVEEAETPQVEEAETPQVEEVAASEVEDATSSPSRRSVIPEASPPPNTLPSPNNSPSPQQDLSLSSFEDPDEDGVLEAENQRILEARQKAIQAQSMALQEQDGDLLGKAAPIGKVQGIDAYRLPTQTLSARGRNEEEPKKKAVVNPVHAGELNPHFKKTE